MLADFLNELKDAFGLKAVEVEVQGEIILRKGIFDKEKRFFDGKLRCYK